MVEDTASVPSSDATSHQIETLDESNSETELALNEDPVSELDSEKTKDLAEEDTVFEPASLRPPLEDFIQFEDFVKWPQFQEAFTQLGDRARFRHIVAAFTALRNLLPRPPDRFLNQLANIAVKTVSTANGNQIARMFYSCGKLRFIHPVMMQSMGEKLLAAKHPLEMDGCDISIAFYSIGILSRFQLLVFAAQKGMRAIDLYQLYARETPPLLFPAQTDVLQALCREIAVPNRLLGFKEAELSNVAYACGLLRIQDEAALTALAREVANSHRLMKFSAQEISNIIYGFGLTQFKETAMLYSMSNHLIRTHRLMELETQHLANILYGFSRVGFVYAPILGALVKEITTPERLRRFREQELANIVSCSALIGIQDANFYRSLGREIIQPRRLGKYMEHNFSTMVLGFANVGVRDVTVLKALAEEMKRPKRLPNYTSKDICDVIMGFNNLEFLDDGFMLGLVAELRKPQRIRKSDTHVWQSCRAHVFSWSLAFPF